MADTIISTLLAGPLEYRNDAERDFDWKPDAIRPMLARPWRRRSFPVIYYRCHTSVILLHRPLIVPRALRRLHIDACFVHPLVPTRVTPVCREESFRLGALFPVRAINRKLRSRRAAKIKGSKLCCSLALHSTSNFLVSSWRQNLLCGCFEEFSIHDCRWKFYRLIYNSFRRKYRGRSYFGNYSNSCEPRDTIWL